MMKQVTYCTDCGGVLNEEIGFCPQCDYEGDSGEDGIPPPADLWDLNLAQLQKLAEQFHVRGWRRLQQKALIYHLSQIRIEQVEEVQKRTDEEEIQLNFSRLVEEFYGFAHLREVDSAKNTFAELSELGLELDEELILTMNWLLLPSQIAAALTIEDIPVLAYEIDDPEIIQSIQYMTEMFEYRTEVKQLLMNIDQVSKIPEELINHHDHVVNGLAQELRERLIDSGRAKAQEKLKQRKQTRKKQSEFTELDAIKRLNEFPGRMLKHEDDELRGYAEKRYAELNRIEELLHIIDSATDAEEIIEEALEHDDDEIRNLANRQHGILQRKHKRKLLHLIKNSRSIDELPAQAFEFSDQEVVDAAHKRKKFLSKAMDTMGAISSIYTSEPLEGLLEHKDGGVREAARLRLRLLDEIPEKMRARGVNPRLIKMIDELAAEWADEAQATKLHLQSVKGKADSVGISLDDEVVVSYIGQNFTGTVQGFTDDGEFVEVLNAETATVWPVPFDCLSPL